jgi:hypothetical protein
VGARRAHAEQPRNVSVVVPPDPGERGSVQGGAERELEQRDVTATEGAAPVGRGCGAAHAPREEAVGGSCELLERVQGRWVRERGVRRDEGGEAGGRHQGRGGQRDGVALGIARRRACPEGSSRGGREGGRGGYISVCSGHGWAALGGGRGAVGGGNSLLLLRGQRVGAGPGPLVS